MHHFGSGAAFAHMKQQRIAGPNSAHQTPNGTDGHAEERRAKAKALREACMTKLVTSAVTVQAAFRSWAARRAYRHARDELACV